MPLFAMIGRDARGHGSKRAAARPAHLEYWGAREGAPPVIFAGPLLDEVGEKAQGSLIIFEADNLEQARDLADLDPYKVGGVFGDVEVHPTKQVLPKI